VGNHWRFGSTTSWHDQYLWFVSSPHEVPGEGYRFVVLAEARAAGLHTWRVERTGGEGRVLFTIYGWNGTTLVAPLADDSGLPRAAASDAAWVAPTEAAAQGEPPVQGCEFAGLPGYGCTCYVRSPGAEVRIPGPARCVATHGSLAGALVSGLLAVVTLGTVLEDPTRTEVQELVESGH
jgi:hypothetical protein